MPSSKEHKKKPNKPVVFGFFLLVLIVAYGNTFQASWHLDDYHTIVNNPKLQVNDLKLSTLLKTFRSLTAKGAYDSDILYRPIPNLSFGLNWYFGKHHLFGYHLVNFTVHYITACILFLIITDLLQTPVLKNRLSDGVHFIPIVASLLWAANPIQTQAVTYIVQRMAAMAAMFYLMGMACYVKGRLKENSIAIRSVYFIFAFICFIFAVLSKENAFLWPLSIGLIEITFFRSFKLNQPIIWKIGIAVFIVIGALSLFMIYFQQETIRTFQNMYVNRSFTPGERLLTEFRVLLYYLSQIFYPIPQRLSIEHDMVVSSSLLDPWTTLPSVLAVVGLVGFGMLNIRKRPVVSFAILFFFLNHTVESTIIGLELIFEHRNYLPSAFLFFPVAVFINHFLQLFKNKNRTIHALMLSSIAVVLVGFVAGTFIRNLDWMTEKTLWEDAIEKAPNSSRAHHNLAWAYYEKIGDYRNALDHYQKALDREAHHKLGRTALLGNMAAIHYRQKNYTEAIRIWKIALAVSPGDEINRYGLACAFTENKDYASALDVLETLTTDRKDNAEFWALKGFVLLKLKDYGQAKEALARSLTLNPHNHIAMVNMGACQNLQGDYDNAATTLRMAYQKDPNNTVLLLWLIDTGLRGGDTADTGRYLDRLSNLVDSKRRRSDLSRQPEAVFILFPPSDRLDEVLPPVVNGQDSFHLRSGGVAHQD